jgi:hypothetical protein
MNSRNDFRQGIAPVLSIFIQTQLPTHPHPRNPAPHRVNGKACFCCDPRDPLSAPLVVIDRKRAHTLALTTARTSGSRQKPFRVLHPSPTAKRQDGPDPKTIISTLRAGSF